jgi:hypothetical protein
VAIAIAATVLAVRTKLNATWYLVGGAVLGVVVKRLGIA